MKIFEIVNSVDTVVRYLPAKRIKLPNGKTVWDKKPYNLQGKWTCPSCIGTGQNWIDIGTECPDCFGKGVIEVPFLTVSEQDSDWINDFLELHRSPMFRENGVINSGNFDFLISKINNYTQPKLKPEPVAGTNVVRLQKKSADVDQQMPVKPVAPPKSQRLADKDGIPQIGSIREPQQYVPDPSWQKRYLDQIVTIIEYAKLEPDVDIVISEI